MNEGKISRETAIQAFVQISKEAEKNGTAAMTLEEINAEIAEVRRMRSDNINSDNTAIHVMQHLQDEMSDSAEEAGLKSEDDVIDMLSEIDREELYAKLQKGLKDVEEGRTRPLDEAFEEIKKRLDR